MIIKKLLPGDIYNSKKVNKISMVYKHSDLEFTISKTNIYEPSVDDLVIGRVIYIHSNYYKLDLKGVYGILPSLSFLNATKRNRPNLNTNDQVLCRVVRLGDELLLSCNEEGLGILDGYVLDIEPWKVKFLYVDQSFLKKLGREFKYKIGLGMNGKIYLSGKIDDLRAVYMELISIE